ncbi:GNAT family N-acetyltransferase [Kineosporia succinea]|uniref:GNAT superfamily N-acetyltransferase n=1 Tax=Kineosporia succinea TaxID=84632 RepID=A0ABT9P909_9ACTN|nr:GNAT family N-acetyltransferase [Kineosporia succinea]MDP9829036.1 GNAT superfamily N-acetyltransferase [Kineosporia succinea]
MKHPRPAPDVLEGIEAEFMLRYQADAPPATQEQLGIRTARIGGGVALSMRHDPTHYWSKALGFAGSPVTGELIGELVAFYRANETVRAGIQIAPSLLPEDWDDIAVAHGLKPGSGIHKLAGRIEELTFGGSDLRIAAIGTGDAHQWATVLLTGFGMPPAGLLGMAEAIASNPAFRAFGAWDGDQLVAVGNLMIQGPVASLNAGATLPAYRGRGAQSALIAARARAAADAGCQWVVSETGESGASLNNMLRAGLESVYLRRNWIWEA